MGQFTVRDFMKSRKTKTLTPTEVGEVCATILYKVYGDLVATYGFSTKARTTPDGPEGNVVFLRLFINALHIIRRIRPTCV